MQKALEAAAQRKADIEAGRVQMTGAIALPTQRELLPVHAQPLRAEQSSCEFCLSDSCVTVARLRC